MSKLVIQLDNLSKQYRLGNVGAGTLRGDFQRWAHKIRGKEDPFLKIGQGNRLDQIEGEYVWALREINLKVKQGEVLGIIGKNGAGKSTLLKILSRVTGPTKGSVNIKGRIGSLLEVGTGFHPELTGRENIFLNGAILGMRKPEIKGKLDEIIEFAGIRKYINTPVKRYSSGMYVRLAFAVAAFMDPEILVVDEVLAVGDADFQKKAIGKMQDVSNNAGRTVLFVSHNMASVQALCTKALVLENGELGYEGSVQNSIDFYMSSKFVENDNILNLLEIKDQQIEIRSFKINRGHSNTINVDINKSNLINIFFSGKINSPMRIAIEARIFDRNQMLLAHYSPSHNSGTTPVFKQGNFELSENIVLPSNITKGEYLLDISISEPRITYKIVLKRYIKINVIGKHGLTGFPFDYNTSGFLILD